MGARSEFRQALRDGDPVALQRIWAAVFPNLPQPKDQAEATVSMHIARTSAGWLSHRARFYSHRWLTERSLPSMLPEDLKPKAERYYANVVSSVGIAAATGKDWLKPALPLIRDAMSKAVLDRQEMIISDPERLRDEIQFARKKEFRRLFGAETATEVER